jgi:cell division protein FtsI (penicillin-binding protein 3)
VNRRRGWIVIVGLVGALVVVLGRVVQIMVVEHDAWFDRARRQQQKIIRVPGPRGQIRSADGYVLATSVDRLAVQLDSHQLAYPEAFARAAAPLLDCEADDLKRRIEHGPRSVWLAQKVERDTAEAVRSLAPHAIVTVPDSARVYPLGVVAAPVVGFVGREELVTVGRSGLEHKYDLLLTGEPQEFLAVKDAVERRLRLERLPNRRRQAGFDLELTLHARLQAACELELERVMETQRARSVSAVVLEARTGSILAVVSLPSFDPSHAGTAPSENWRLRPVQDAYEPGSTVKPIVAAAALSEGVVRPGERFDCRLKGATVAGRWMRDHATPGLYTLDEVVVESANAGMIEIAERIDADALWTTFDAFGFGRKTGVGYPGESRGILPAVRSWSGLSRASLSLGQELTTTPLQLAVAYAAIANGGWLLQPRLLARAEDGRESVDERQQWRARVLDEALCVRIQSILESVVRDGTGGMAALPGYRIAGKTGTAQRAHGGAFDDVHHVAWFAGFFPMPDPSVVVVVAVEEPQVDFWASAVAAPAFARIAAAVACHLGIPPTEPTGAAEGEAI